MKLMVWTKLQMALFPSVHTVLTVSHVILFLLFPTLYCSYCSPHTYTYMYTLHAYLYVYIRISAYFYDIYTVRPHLRICISDIQFPHLLKYSFYLNKSAIILLYTILLLPLLSSFLTLSTISSRTDVCG